MKKLIKFYIQLLKRPLLLLRHSRVPLSTSVNNHVVVANCKIGKYCYLGQGDVMNNVIMGNYCSIAPNVIIGGMEHSYWFPSTSTHLSNECISNVNTYIGHDVWIGANAIIKQGVIIGDGAIIGAGSVVTKDVAENTIVCGVPAKFLKNRFDINVWNDIKKSRYWDFDKRTAKRLISKINY